MGMSNWVSSPAPTPINPIIVALPASSANGGGAFVGAAGAILAIPPFDSNELAKGPIMDGVRRWPLFLLFSLVFGRTNYGISRWGRENKDDVLLDQLMRLLLLDDKNKLY